MINTHAMMTANERLLLHVQPGMLVYDRLNKKVGSVRIVNIDPDALEQPPAGLLVKPFILIDIGKPPEPDRLILADQIVELSASRLRVNVLREHMAVG